MDKEAPHLDEWTCKLKPGGNYEFVSLVFRVTDKDKLMNHLEKAMSSFCNQKSAEEIGGQCIVHSLSNLSEYEAYAEYTQNVVDGWIAGPMSFEEWRANGMPEYDEDQM